MFTDGSKQEETSGTALVVEDTMVKQRLPDIVSNYIAQYPISVKLPPE